MSDQEQRFDEWAVVELMGHQRMAGRVSEQTLAGAAFLRVDVPEVVVRGLTIPPFTRFVAAAAVYAINPTSEQIARAVASRVQAEPISRYEMPQLTAGQDDQEDEDQGIPY